MKRRNRVLLAISSVGFGLAIVIAAVTIVCIFFPTIFNPHAGLKFGLEFVPALENFLVVFDFFQTEYDIFVQYAALGIIALGGIISLLWLILGLCKKHFIEILLFFLTLLCTAYFAFISFYGIDYVLTYISTEEIQIWPLLKKIFIVADFLVPSIIIFIAFIYDMVRIFARPIQDGFEESPKYTPHQLFEEMFPTEKEEQQVISDEERARIEALLEEEAAKILEEEKRNAPIAPEDIPPVLFEEEPEPEIPPILYEPEPEPELPPVLFEPEEEEVEEELRPEDLPPILFEKPEEEEVERELRPEDIPPILFREERVEEEPFERPACLDREPELFEPLPFMVEGFVNREEKAQFPARQPFEEERLPMFEEVVEVSEPAVEPAVKSNSKAYHLSHKDGGVQVKAAGEKEAEAILPTEEEAINYVRYYYPGSSIRIHDKNGKIRTI